MARRQKTTHGIRTTTIRTKEQIRTKITISEQAEATADYLETSHWATNPNEDALTADIPTTKLNKQPPQYNSDQITKDELLTTIKYLKNNKTPGPDQLEAEMF